MNKMYPTYEEAKQIVKDNGLTNLRDYKKNYMKYNLPSHPDYTYRNNGWVDSYDFFSKSQPNKYSYEQAKEIVLSEGIKSIREYKRKRKNLSLPSHPDEFYKEQGWIDWPSFFGKESRISMTFEQVQEIVLNNSISSYKDYKKSYKELGLPSNPPYTFKDCGWKSWSHFFCKEPPKSFPSYNEAKQIVKAQGVLSFKKYKECYKELGLPNYPPATYKDAGWNGWFEFFDTPAPAPAMFPTYEQAKLCVQTYGISSSKDYINLYKKMGLPSHPHNYYKDDWLGWYDFLGNNKPKELPSFDQAKEIVKAHGISTCPEYHMKKKALGLPAAPNMYYQDKGWTNWFDFFGKEKTRKINSDCLDSHKVKIHNTLLSVLLDKTILIDDSSLSMLIPIALLLGDQSIRKLTETLLLTNFEDRLDYVRMALKELKEGFDLKSHTDDVHNSWSPILESEDIVEDKKVMIKSIIENYYHNKLNKELMEDLS